MREIKFRGRNPYSHEWVYGYFFVTKQLGIDHPQIWQENGSPIPVDPETVGQYIGLHDRSGRDFYEGDIVQCEAIGVRGIITWSDTYPGFVILNPERSGAYVIHTDWEVIGNRYDHLELLQGG